MTFLSQAPVELFLVYPRSWVQFLMGVNFRLGKKGHSLVPLAGMDEPSCGGQALV